MMRFSKYQCPNKTTPFPGECHYEAMDGAVCVHCGKSYSEAETIWDKIESLYYTILPYHLRPKNIWYAFKCRIWKKYTTIKPRALGHTWCDRDHILIHVIFEVLCQFVEEELIDGPVDWDATECHAAARDEMMLLHTWWTEEFLNLEDGIPDMIDEDGKYDLVKEAEWHVFVRDQCKRVIDVSPYMWT